MKTYQVFAVAIPLEQGLFFNEGAIMRHNKKEVAIPLEQGLFFNTKVNI